MAPIRKTVTKEERAVIRAARKERVTQSLEATAATTEASSSSSSSFSSSKGATVEGSTSSSTNTTTTTTMSSGKKKLYEDPRLIFGLGFGIPTALLAWGLNDENSPPAKFSRLIGLSGYIESTADTFNRPYADKLLPDWTQMPNVPHDMPVPHTLVLDLENTLVHSSWDRKYGWRHAKRPGVDKFLTELAQYYEIVLYSPSHEGVAQPVVDSLDKSGCILHRLYRDACYFKNGIYMKDLSALNRNPNRIILIDDDPNAAGLNPQNLIKVKPYLDPHDRKDDTLERITPFLIEISREQYDDVPTLLAQFGGMDADGIADELERRVEALRDSRMKSAQRGLGKFASSRASSSSFLPPPEMTPLSKEQLRQQANAPSPQLTAKDLVGADPTSGDSSSGGGTGSGISGWLQRRQKEQEEEHMRKMEKWNEIMMKKSMEKQQQEEAAGRASM